MRYLFPLSPWNQQRQFEKMTWVFPCHMAAYATYLRNKRHDVCWAGVNDPGRFDRVIKDDFDIDIPFEELPYPDRMFTDAKNPRWQAYGNYKFHPATHMMASNLCWWGKCTFCVDTLKLNSGEKRGVRSVDHVMKEIDDLISQGYREVFDDSGTFPIGDWLEEFLDKLIASGRNKKIVVGCNMKPISPRVVPFKKMKEAGFRFILVGVESANQETLDRIGKGQRAEDAILILKSMNDVGLEPHVTFMTGYPWETPEGEQRSIDLCHHLLKKGYAKTAQVSVFSPPRTVPDLNSLGHKYLTKFYDVYKSPKFWIRKLCDLRRWEDFTYLLRGAKLVLEEKLRSEKWKQD